MFVADAFDPVSAKTVVQKGGALESLADGKLGVRELFLKEITRTHGSRGTRGEARARKSSVLSDDGSDRVINGSSGHMVVPHHVAHFLKLIKDDQVPYTRIHEPRHLHPERTDYPVDKTMIIKEYSLLDDGSNPFYPISDEKNHNLVLKYREESSMLKNVFISGRLGDYKYYDMHDTIKHALELYDKISAPYKAGRAIPDNESIPESNII
jgi:hypothetical protein